MNLANYLLYVTDFGAIDVDCTNGPHPIGASSFTLHWKDDPWTMAELKSLVDQHERQYHTEEAAER